MLGDEFYNFSAVPLNTRSSVLYLIESEKSPGTLLLGRTIKLPSVPCTLSKASASEPERFGWNHLQVQPSGTSVMTYAKILKVSFYDIRRVL